VALRRDLTEGKHTMKLQVLAGAAVLALIAATNASAATHHHKAKLTRAGAFAEPAQPIAYCSTTT